MDTEEQWTSVYKSITSHSDYFNQLLLLLPNNILEKQPSKQDVEIDNAEEEDPYGETITGFQTDQVPQSELKDKFHLKIEELRNKRKVAPGDEENEQGRLKRRKIEEKRKNKKDSEKQKSKPKNKSPKAEKTQSTEIKTKTKPPVENLETQSMEFTFDVTSNSHVPSYVKNRKKPLSRQKQLIALQEKQQNLEALKQTPEGKKQVENEAWDTMMKKASGEKVKDDASKLKKSIKKTEAKKAKSSKDWESRIKQQQKSRKEAHAKRKANLDARKQAKKDKKMGVVKKKSSGKARPGFEGKKKSFIGSKK